MKQNKKIGLIFAFILIAVLLSNFAFARTPGEIFTDSLISMNNFFENESYKPFSKLIDFVFFSIVFMSLFTVGAKKVFSEYTKPIQVIVILFGLALALVFVLADISFMNLFKYAWYILYILLFGLLYYMLGKLGMKNWFGKFLLALLIILAIILLISGLNISEGQTYFNSLSNKFKGIEIPDTSKSSSAFGDLFEEADTTTTTTTGRTSKSSTSGSDSKGIFTWANSGYLVLGIVALLALRRWAKKHRKNKDQEPRDESPEGTIINIQDIVNQIEDVIEKKEKTKETIKNLVNNKYKNTNKLYIENKRKIRDRAYFRQRRTFWKKGSPEYETVLTEDNYVKKLLKYEYNLEKSLIELKREEDKLIININKWEEIIVNGIDEAYRQKWKNSVLIVLSKLKSNDNGIESGLILEIRKLIVSYFYLSKDEVTIEKELKVILDPKNSERWVTEKWKAQKDIKIQYLEDYLIKEENVFKILSGSIVNQIKYLKWIKKVLEWVLQKEKAYTRVSIKIEPEAAEEANGGVITGTSIRIIPQINGTFPIRCTCLIRKENRAYTHSLMNNKELGGPEDVSPIVIQTNRLKDVYEIIVIARGKGGLNTLGKSTKRIKVNPQAGEPKPIPEHNFKPGDKVFYNTPDGNKIPTTIIGFIEGRKIEPEEGKSESYYEYYYEVQGIETPVPESSLEHIPEEVPKAKRKKKKVEIPEEIIGNYNKSLNKFSSIVNDSTETFIQNFLFNRRKYSFPTLKIFIEDILEKDELINSINKRWGKGKLGKKIKSDNLIEYYVELQKEWKAIMELDKEYLDDIGIDIRVILSENGIKGLTKKIKLENLRNYKDNRANIEDKIKQKFRNSLTESIEIALYIYGQLKELEALVIQEKGIKNPTEKEEIKKEADNEEAVTGLESKLDKPEEEK